MKICIVAYKFGTEQEIGEHLGTYHYFIEKMRTLVCKGHEVYVVAPWISFFRKGSREVDGAKVLRYFPPLWNKAKAFPLNRLIRWLYIKKTQKRVLALDKEKKLDIIYVWQARETGYAIAQIADSLRSSFIFRQITAWQWHFERSTREVLGERSWFLLLEKFRLDKVLEPVFEQLLDRRSQVKFARVIYKKAKKIVFVSRAASREGLDMGLAPEKVEVIGVGIETDLFKPTDAKQEWRKKLGVRGDKVILFIGRISFAEKGIGYLLKAVPEIIKTVQDVNLVIIGGGGDSSRMRELIKELNIGQYVQLVGKKSFSDLVKYLNASDVMVVPSVWVEHFGQVTIEAMSCEVPVVTTNIGGSPEINLDGQTGFTVPPKDSKAIAEAVIKLLRNESLRQRVGQAARKRVQENYTYEVLVNKFLKLVKDVR